MPFTTFCIPLTTRRSSWGLFCMPFFNTLRSSWGLFCMSFNTLRNSWRLFCMPFFHTLRSSWGLYYMLMATCCMPITTQSNRNCISLLRLILSGSGSFPTKWPTFDACRPAGKEKMAWKLLLNAPTRI